MKHIAWTMWSLIYTFDVIRKPSKTAHILQIYRRIGERTDAKKKLDFRSMKVQMFDFCKPLKSNSWNSWLPLWLRNWQNTRQNSTSKSSLSSNEGTRLETCRLLLWKLLLFNEDKFHDYHQDVGDKRYCYGVKLFLWNAFLHVLGRPWLPYETLTGTSCSLLSNPD